MVTPTVEHVSTETKPGGRIIVAVLINGDWLNHWQFVDYSIQEAEREALARALADATREVQFA